MNEFITVNAKNVAFKRHKQIICTEIFDFSQELWNSLGSELGFGDIIKTVSYAIEKYPLSPTQDVLLSPSEKLERNNIFELCCSVKQEE